MLKSLTIFQQAVFAFVFLALAGLSFVIIQPMIIGTHQIHKPAKWFFKAQTQGLSARQLMVKLKLDTHYTVFHSRDKIAFTLGPLGKITSTSVFEVNRGPDW